MKENSREEDIARIARLITTKFNNDYSIDNKDKEAIEHILSAYKRALKENEQLRTEVNSLKKKNYEELKEDYYNLINKIENKIDKFDYEFEKAKRQNNKDKADYYWDLIRNFKKLLESEE